MTTTPERPHGSSPADGTSAATGHATVTVPADEGLTEKQYAERYAAEHPEKSRTTSSAAG